MLEMEKLNETMERQRTEIARLRNLLDLTGAGKVLGFDLGIGFKNSCSGAPGWLSQLSIFLHLRP